MVLNVVCFLWGDWPEPGLGYEYVVKLKSSVMRNLSLPHNFICFMDEYNIIKYNAKTFMKHLGIEVRTLHAYSWVGKFPKLYAYNRFANLEGRVLILDLDTVVTGNLNEIASYRGDFCVRAWFKGIPKNEWVPDGDMIAFEANSKTAKHIDYHFNTYLNHLEVLYEGRERLVLKKFVPNSDMWQKLYPGQIVSYKNDCLKGLPENARLVSFHGDPRPHVVQEKWVLENWR